MALAGSEAFNGDGPRRGRRRAGRRPFATVALIAALASGCRSGRPETVQGASPDLLALLQVGVTTRDDVFATLGPPCGLFEQGRILTYRIGEDRSEARFVIKGRIGDSWYVPRYSLVLAFDGEGVLKKKNLVTVKDLRSGKDSSE